MCSEGVCLQAELQAGRDTLNMAYGVCLFCVSVALIVLLRQAFASSVRAWTTEGFFFRNTRLDQGFFGVAIRGASVAQTKHEKPGQRTAPSVRRFWPRVVRW